MKKALVNTRVSVKLRKSEYRDEWYLYVESYPVFQSGKDTPQRVREYLNRTITTPIWDKSRNARTNAEGKTTYKPKRDLNGVIQCKSQLDQESCIYADKVRRPTTKGIRQCSFICRIPMQNRRSSWNAPEVISLSTSTMCSEQGMPIALILSLSTGGECMNYLKISQR